METLTEQKVTRLLEFVIRGHLGWLVVWGNVFGAIIGACHSLEHTQTLMHAYDSSEDLFF